MANTLTLVCTNCRQTFSRKNYQVKKTQQNFFCTLDCSNKWSKSNKTRGKTVNCKTCNIRFFKRNSEIKKTVNHFCSRSCAAKFNNQVPKRARKPRLCKICNIDITYMTEQGKNNAHTLCKDCYNPAPINARSLRSLLTGVGTNWRARVSDHARYTFKKSDKPKCCVVCGYDKHYDVCHIKAVSSFDLDTLVSVVNGLDNLVALCKNHHWEFDKAGLDITEFLDKK